MVEIQGKKYISPKEASHSYGYSESWFEKARCTGEGPKWIKVGEKPRGKIYYEKIALDNWFLRNS